MHTQVELGCKMSGLSQAVGVLFMEGGRNSSLAASVIGSAEEARFALADIPSRVEPRQVLMCDPSYFEIKDAKNPFMEGNLNSTDPKGANRQWHALKQTYENLGYPVRLISAQKNLEDMVFTANQVLPGKEDDGLPYVVLSEMVHPSRQAEVPFFAEWFEGNGYQLMRLTGDSASCPRFEGQGDAIWHPGKRLLWGGYGFRTQEAAYTLLSELLCLPVLKLELVNSRFYHLDTAFCVLDVDCAMIYPDAFNERGLALIRRYFARVLEVSEADAANFACNAHALGRKVILQAGSPDTCQALRGLGFEPVEVETGEFMKSGGSVFCLKMMVF